MDQATTTTRGLIGIKLIDTTGIIARFRYMSHSGEPSYDRILMYRDSWETLPPPARLQGLFCDEGKVVEFLAPPGWSPPDQSVAPAACFGFAAPVAFPSAPSAFAPIGR